MKYIMALFLTLPIFAGKEVHGTWHSGVRYDVPRYEHRQHRSWRRVPRVFVDFRPYYSPSYPVTVPVIIQPSQSQDRQDVCRKETLKNSEGRKRDVLICRQPDGSVQVVDSDR